MDTANSVPPVFDEEVSLPVGLGGDAPSISSATKHGKQAVVKKQSIASSGVDSDPLSMFASESAEPPSPPQNTRNLANFDFNLHAAAAAAAKKPPSTGAVLSSPPQIRHESRPTESPNEYTVVTSDETSDLEKFPYFSGEQILLSLRDAVILHPSGQLIPGTISMTSYRLIFIPTQRIHENLRLRTPGSWFQVPLACIDKLEKEKRGKDIRTNNITIMITCKDARTYRIAMMCKPSTVISSPNDPLHHTEADIERAVNVMFAYTFPNNVSLLFAFSYAPHAAKHFTRLDPYDPIVEISRMGILDSSLTPWRISIVNMDFRICDSYPKVIVVPKQLTDDDVKVVAHFRSGGRLPVLCWGDKVTMASIWRSSQPKAGVSGSCALDEKYLDIIAKSSLQHAVPAAFFDSAAKQPPDSISPSTVSKTVESSATLSGFQSFFRSSSNSSNSRPTSISSLDKISGGTSVLGSGGSASVDFSQRSAFDESHVLMIVDCRPKANAMVNKAAGAGYETSGNYPNTRIEFYNIGNIHVMRESHRNLLTLVTGNSGISSDLAFSKAVEDTQWLGNLRLVLKASWETANFVSKGYPVLVHCSHGWDRTPQVTALAQLFLDPYFRTFDGFRILVEKEWISFGHQFTLRCAHGRDKANRQDDQISPIFLQFLDCVWQIRRQFPSYFEFNSRYLLTLADEIYSCRFGTFIYDTDKDREVNEVEKKCITVWSYLEQNREKLLYTLYRPLSETFLPQLSPLLRSVTLWTDYYFRWSEACPRAVACIDSNLLNDTVLSHSTAEADTALSTLQECVDPFELELDRERSLRISLEKELRELRLHLDAGSSVVSGEELSGLQVSDGVHIDEVAPSRDSDPALKERGAVAMQHCSTTNEVR